jgi:hypothetical protein
MGGGGGGGQLSERFPFSTSSAVMLSGATILKFDVVFVFGIFKIKFFPGSPLLIGQNFIMLSMYFHFVQYDILLVQ